MPTPTPSSSSHAGSSAVVDEAMRITAEGARRSTETAKAALQQTRTYFDHATELNRDLFALWSDSADAWFQTAFEIQNAAFGIGKTTFDRYAALAQKAQATTLKSYQAGAKLMNGVLQNSD